MTSDEVVAARERNRELQATHRAALTPDEAAAKNPEMRAEWGIILGYGDERGIRRAYIPTRRSVYSRRYFQPKHSKQQRLLRLVDGAMAGE